ncbi:MAG: ribonuclease P protein component [Synechococcaceae cyanobacterium]|jgi:ribonuclease P protein component
MVLPQRHRLRGVKVLDRILRQGRRLHGSAMVLRLLPAHPNLLPPRDRAAPPSPWRCGVVVSGKVSRSAVVRNRLRRQLHAGLLADPPRPDQPLWLLLSLRPGSAELPSHALLGECSDLLRRAGLLP